MESETVHGEACVGPLICVSRQVTESFVLRRVLQTSVEFVYFSPSGVMVPQSVKVQEPIRFGEDFELDLTSRRLSRGNRVLKVERIPRMPEGLGI
jgi:hypothetical protein